MSFKTLFDKARTISSLANKSSKQIGGEVESRGYHTEDIIKEKRFLPRVDYSNPKNFARYGSAEEYYKQSIVRVYDTYPYDGSLRERLEWENESTYLDLYLFDNLYPRTNGYIKFSPNGWGALDGTIRDGYGLPKTLEYIYFEGGPHPNPNGMTPYARQFTGSNYYEPDRNRSSNLKLDPSTGATVEFWLKKENFDRFKTEKEVIFDLWNTEDTSSADYGRFRLELSASEGTGSASGADPFRLTFMSGTVGFVTASIASSTFTTSSLANNTWNHYAVTLKNSPPSKSIQFSGSTDYTQGIKVGPASFWNSQLGSDKQISVSMWVYKTADTSGGGAQSRLFTIGTGANQFEILSDSSERLQVVADCTPSDLTDITDVNCPPLNEWHHLMVTWDGGAATPEASTVYLDGQPRAFISSTARNGWLAGGFTHGANIGNNAAASKAWDGYINNVAVWNRKLTSDEAISVYNNGVPGDLLASTAPSSLVSWWPLGSDPDDSLDGTDTPSTTNHIVDKTDRANGYAEDGTMANTQIVGYSPVNTSVVTDFYVNGSVESSKQIQARPGGAVGAAGPLEIDSPLVATIGALATTADDTSAPAYAGKLSASLDEFRYWKEYRLGKGIGRYWFDQVGGGTNTDPKPFTDTQEEVNTNLGVYYKFNEGITGDSVIDKKILDYSGRVSNGAWTGYTSDSRSTGSAIVESLAAIREFKDPIIYSSHPQIVALRDSLIISGSDHDGSNNAMVINSIPAWISEEDEEGQGHLKKLTQIMASYFDTLQLQIESLNKLKDVQYVSGSTKPLPFADRLLNSHGFVSPEIFLDADILEKLADRSEDRLYEKTLNDLKNIIYQNIYNNLIYIYKSKGTEKSFRNLIRCFGIDDELLKLKMYARNTEYKFRENRRTLILPSKVVDFNTSDNSTATVFSYQDPSGSNTNAYGYLTSSVELTGGWAYTLETDIIFPSKQLPTSETYFDTNVLTASLFGIHSAQDSESDTSWRDNDYVNFQVFAERDELQSQNVKFVLTGTAGGFVPRLETTLYEDTYNDVHWNLAVRIKPERYPLVGMALDSNTGNYIIELHGEKVEGGFASTAFTVSGAISAPPAGFITGSKRVFVGAHRTNFTGAVRQSSDVKVEACRFWLDYVPDSVLRAHALDSENFGALQPHSYAFPSIGSGSALYGDVTQFDTLAFNWEFSENTGSNTNGQFVVADESSGSTANIGQFNGLGELLNKQYTGLGYGFAASATAPIEKEFEVISRLNDIETIAPAETITVLSAEDQHVFKIDSRPINYFFAFEKSMYNTISEQIVNYFGNLKDFNNLIGQPVNRYRHEYKSMAFMRQKFFERVGNEEIDFDRFYEFYKWFDSSLSFMLGQLVPASADFADNVRTVIEDHALERNKYKSVVPFLDTEQNVFDALLASNVEYGDAISSPDDDATGTGFYPVHAPRARVDGLSAPGFVRKWKYTHAPPGLSQDAKYLWWKFMVDRSGSFAVISSARPLFLIQKPNSHASRF